MNDSFIQYDQVLAILDFSDALEKNMKGYIITHLSFEFDFMRMKIHLPSNKKLHALTAIQVLLETKTMMTVTFDEILSFLSHCSQVISLNRSFLHNLFLLLHRINKMTRIY